MPYSIKVLEEARTVEVRHESTFDMDEVTAARREVSLVLRAKGFKRLFIDALEATFGGQVTDHNLFLMTGSEAFEPDVRIAVVLGEQIEFMRSDIEYFSKQGGTNMRLFTEAEDAWEWLSSDTTGRDPEGRIE